jgi:hypothetical protein
VLFVDTPQKIFNPDWANLGLSSFEDDMRHRVGSIVPVDDVDRIGEAIAALIEQRLSRSNELEELRARVVYNHGQSGKAGADLIEELVGRL